MSTVPATKGLEGVVAATSSICYIDGEQGILAYRGIDIHELAQHSSFEEVCYLLWFAKFPTAQELSSFRTQLASARQIDPAIISLLKSFPKSAPPMEVLRTAVSALSMYDPESAKVDHDSNIRKSIRMTSQIAMIVADFDRIRKGKDIVEADKSLSTSANFLLMLNGEKPSFTADKALDVALILHADHELNASTFAARVTAATLSDMHSAITGAIGALKGPLHGGANEQVMKLLQSIPEGATVDDEIRGRLERKERIMGFGHRVYKTYDPRAVILKRFSKQLADESGDPRWYDMSEQIEQTVMSEKGLYPNVDFYSASTYHYLGIDTGLFTPIFAMSRVVGWAAHVIEQHADNRLIRPSSEYVGPAVRDYEPIERRSAPAVV